MTTCFVVKSYVHVSGIMYLFTTIVLLIHLLSLAVFAGTCGKNCGNETYWLVLELYPVFALIFGGYLTAYYAKKKANEEFDGTKGILVAIIVIALFAALILTLIKFFVFAIGSLILVGRFGVSPSQLGVMILSIFTEIFYSFSAMIFSFVIFHDDWEEPPPQQVIFQLGSEIDETDERQHHTVNFKEKAAHGFDTFLKKVSMREKPDLGDIELESNTPMG